MLDAQGRIKIGSQMLSKNKEIVLGGKVNIYYDDNNKRLLISPIYCEQNDLYYLKTQSIDIKGRFFVPIAIRKSFPNATYLPAEKEGKIYILIL